MSEIKIGKNLKNSEYWNMLGSILKPLFKSNYIKQYEEDLKTPDEELEYPKETLQSWDKFLKERSPDFNWFLSSSFNWGRLDNGEESEFWLRFSFLIKPPEEE